MNNLSLYLKDNSEFGNLAGIALKDTRATSLACPRYWSYLQGEGGREGGGGREEVRELTSRHYIHYHITTITPQLFQSFLLDGPDNLV